jgi:predicted Zn-ribbon and HTH transcriptional regulator
MTTFLDKLKNRTSSIVQAALSAKKEIMALVVSDDIKESRMATCNSCEFLFTPTMQCRKCGCFVEIKTAVAPFKCPIGKWQAVSIPNNDN